MNRLTSQSRKLIYLILIVCLLIPITMLGMPSSSEPESGGKLSALRTEHHLGESSLGQVDPASSTMNLLLLGLRGVATNLLWMDADQQKDTKNWAQLRATVDSIILLQPHYPKVWRYQAWNLAYNVSAEWDSVADRYFWVKEGIKFLIEGNNRNQENPELLWDTGNFFGQKIGRSDEWKQFRDFFFHDPEPRFNGGVDPVLNPDIKDNYLVAKSYFLHANEAEETHEQHIMAGILFRHYPIRAQFDYPGTLQREGIFGETTTEAWRIGFEEWTQIYGQELYDSPGGKVKLEATDEDVKQLARQDNVTVAVKKEWVDRYQKMTNYTYWRTLSLIERTDKMMQAHREMYQGEQAFKESRMSEAQSLLESGMTKYMEILSEYPDLQVEENAIEEGIMAVLLWKHIHELEGRQPPEIFPLKPLWDQHQDRIAYMTNDFRRRYGIE